MTTSVGRMQAALASATNELTIAAANLNFDFSIVKYEAPKEFQPVGQLLSMQRKHEAEDGSCHSVARRLSALFAGVCPASPALIAAYGKRASEIAEEATSRVSKEHIKSVFSQYTGVDATSMWAAATSSGDPNGSAVHMHLLACLLASVWEAPEATSIWVQLVQERRGEVAQCMERGDEVPFKLAAAAAPDKISRSDLASWDASARAWLETANEIKKKEQAQLRLILKNVEYCIRPQATLYKDVVEVWRIATSAMDNIVSGIAQEIHNGAAILGLSAWHLYPDMQIFGQRQIEVTMTDPLIPAGGLLSLGCSPSVTGSQSGITWSLSLANLKYYGEPVKTTTEVRGDHSSRLSADEFRLVVLGSILRMWNIAPAQESLTIKLLAALSLHILHHMGGQLSENRDGWGLLEKAEALHQEDGPGADPFIKLGRNRPHFKPADFDGRSGQVGSKQFFGLLDVKNFLACLKSPEDRVSALRRCGSRIDQPGDYYAALIRYKTADGQARYTPLLNKDSSMSGMTGCAYSPDSSVSWTDPELTTPAGIPTAPSISSRVATSSNIDHAVKDTSREFEQRGDGSHRVDASDESPTNNGNRSEHENSVEDILRPDASTSRNTAVSKHSRNESDSNAGLNHDHANDDEKDDQAFDDSGGEGDSDTDDDESGYEDNDYDDSDSDGDASHKSTSHVFHRLYFTSHGETYHFAFGDDSKAAIYFPSSRSFYSTAPSILPEDVWWALRYGKFGTHIAKYCEGNALFRWIAQFGYATRCLEEVGGNLIPVAHLRQRSHWSHYPHWVWHWRKRGGRCVPHLQTADTLAILAYFLGNCDISPADIEGSITGMSYKNSIYVPCQLLRDPLSGKEHGTVARVLGNIGQPGLVLFSSVCNPMIWPIDDQSWRVINMNRFDGQPEDHFGSTSMHLGFTKWERSLDVHGAEGNQDVQFTKKESVIAIRDFGRWIGDFDLVGALNSPHITRLQSQAPCDHRADDWVQDDSLRSIESWDELRECQHGLAVVRVHGNWLARLAVTAYLARQANENEGRGPKITLLPAKMCWTCLEHVNHSTIYIW